MVNISICELDQIIMEGQIAYQYAWEHYDELFARKPAHVLYGPLSHFLGAASPSHTTSPKERVLKNTLRRKDYSAYELDKDYRIIKNYRMLNKKIDAHYLHFQLNGVHYARGFYLGIKKDWENNQLLHAIRYINGIPQYYAVIDDHLVIAEFYEYVSDAKMLVTTYYYRPKNKHVPQNTASASGMPLLHYDCVERTPQSIDFRRFFPEQCDDLKDNQDPQPPPEHSH